MRIDTKLSLVAHSSVGREVKSVSGVHALKPLTIDAYQTGDAAAHRHHHAINDDDAHVSAQYGAERRKTCRRIRQQAILMELRSGGDRRNTLSEDIGFGHVDEGV